MVQKLLNFLNQPFQYIWFRAAGPLPGVTPVIVGRGPLGT